MLLLLPWFTRSCGAERGGRGGGGEGKRHQGLELEECSLAHAEEIHVKKTGYKDTLSRDTCCCSLPRPDTSSVACLPLSPNIVPTLP